MAALPGDEDPNYPRLPRSPQTPDAASHATESPIVIAVGRNWNEEYQQLLAAATTNAPSLERTAQLRKLCEEFASCAKRIGTTILSELYVSPQKRTIQPITQHLGGIAGGEKYIHDGIFFKLAVDKKGLYGGDEGIMKAAGHEMRSLMSCLDCRIQGLHFPLILLVDYRGHRLIAQSLLPIGGDTLIYGSSDSGTVIHTDDPEMNARMALVAKILNLRADHVSNWAKTSKTLLHGPIDIEGHKGRDGRFYLVDSARLFPPAASQETVRGGFLYRLLRPELVKSNAVPLSSNALSNWTMDDSDKADQDVREATRRLHDEVVPSFARFLDDEWAKAAAVTSEPLRVQLQSLLTEMHRRGINMRLMGMVRSSVASLSMRMLLLTDMIARTVKNNLRAQMRKLRSTEEREYHTVAINYFNLVFGHDEKSRIQWTIELKDCVQKRFRSALTQDEQSVLFDLRSAVYIYLLFQRVQEMFGVLFRKETQERIVGDLHAFEPLVAADLAEFAAVATAVHRINFEEATALAQQASKTGAADLLRIADEKYNASVQQKPDDYRSLHNWGLSLMLQALSKKGEEADALFKLAASKFHAALAMDPRDFRALFLWANMLSEQSRFKEGKDGRNLLILACAKYQKAHNIDPNNFELLYNWGNALLYRAKAEEDKEVLKQAAEKYELATKLKPASHKCLRNWAVAVAKLARQSEGETADALFTKAGDLCKECARIRATDWEVLFNWGNTLYRWARAKEREHDNARALKLLRSAAEKYVAVLDLDPSNADALHNWGKVLYSNGTLIQQKLEKGDVESLCREVDMYLALFCSFALKFSTKVTLKAPTALAQLRIPSINGAVCAALQRLTSAPDPKLRAQATKTVQMLVGTNPAPTSPASGRSSVPDNIVRIVKRLSNTEVQKVTISDFEVLRAAKHEEEQQERELHVRLTLTGQRFYLRMFSYEAIGLRLGRPVDESGIDAILASLSHPYITPFDFVIHSSDTCFLVYDTLTCVPVRKLAGEDGRLGEEQLRSLMAEAVLAVAHFHEKGFVYQYLRPDDLLVDPDGHLSLSRFAFHLPTSDYPFEADWVALGRAAFELLSGVRDKSALVGLQVKFSPEFLSFAKALLGKVLKSGAEIKAHPFFSTVQWSVLAARTPPVRSKPKLVASPPEEEGFQQYDTTNFEAAPTLVAKLKKGKFRGFTYVEPSPK